MLANATMPSGAKWLIHALGSLTDESVTIVHLLSSQIFLEGPGGLAARIDPAVWIPFRVILPYFPVDLSERRGGDDSVTFGDDILTVFRRGGKGTRDNDIGYDHALCLGEKREERLSSEGSP